MPSKSKAQKRLMAAAAHDKAFAARAGIPQSVAKDYVQADKARGSKHLPTRVRKSGRGS